MNYDWNWFFSSFSQCAAALIGIIAAFIISRLLGQMEKLNLIISDLNKYKLEFNKIKKILSFRNFDKYINDKVFYDSNLRNNIRNGFFFNMNDDEVCKKIYNDIPDLYKNDKIILHWYNFIYNKAFTQQNEKTSENEWSQFINYNTQQGGYGDRFKIEKEEIEKVKVEAYSLIESFNQNLQNLKSFQSTIKPLKIIIILLMVSFILTVVYPLHFMPIAENQNPTVSFNLYIIFKFLFSLKSIILFFLITSIEGIFVYFLNQIKHLNNKLIEAIKDNKDEYRNIENYSSYLAPL